MKVFKIFFFAYYVFSSTLFFAISEFYFVRHGQTDFNIKKELKNWNMPLNTTGRQQIESLRTILEKLPIENIFFSPLIRTQETKNIINQYLDLCAFSLPEIKEAKEGLYLEIMALKNNKDNKCSKKLTKFLNRVSKGISQVLNCPKLSLVVGHGAVYAAICYLLDIKTSLWRLHNGGIVHFYKQNDAWKVQLVSR